MNGQQQSQQQLQITGSELLKRKTLKSIKRYRQTKQNTEPCNLITEDPSVQCISNHSNQLQQQYQQSMPQQVNNLLQIPFSIFIYSFLT